MSHLAWRKPQIETAAVNTGADRSRKRPFLPQRRSPHRGPGIAFDIPDLLLAQAWAQYHGVRLHIRLDHVAGKSAYEEVLELNTGRKTLSGLMMWRHAGGVLVRRTLGKKRRFDSVADALESLLPEAPVVVTDLIPVGWPDRGD